MIDDNKKRSEDVISDVQNHDQHTKIIDVKSKDDEKE
jgi:hypothetical protein